MNPLVHGEPLRSIEFESETEEFVHNLMNKNEKIKIEHAMDIMDATPQLNRLKLMYCSNVEIKLESFTKELYNALQEYGQINENELSNISDKLRPEMQGINTPMFYFGGNLSYSEMHVEDGCLESANVVYFNLYAPATFPSKAWIIVHQRDYTRLTTIVSD